MLCSLGSTLRSHTDRQTCVPDVATKREHSQQSAPTQDLFERTRAHAHKVVDIRPRPSNTVWSKYGTYVVTFRAGLPGSCVLPRRPLPPSRVPCLRPVFFNTATCWPRVLRSVSPRGPGCLAANMGAGRVCAVSESQAAHSSPPSSPGR